MTFRDLNNPETHDGTRFEWNFGGPFHVTVRLNGERILSERTSKGDRMLVHLTPVGEWGEDNE
jgi:predicted SpoU family rRNA methylase